MATKTRQTDFNEKLRQIEEEIAQTEKKITALKDKKAQLIREMGEIEDKAIKALLKEKGLSFKEAEKIISGYAPSEISNSPEEKANTNTEKSGNNYAENQFSKGENINEEENS